MFKRLLMPGVLAIALSCTGQIVGGAGGGSGNAGGAGSDPDASMNLPDAGAPWEAVPASVYVPRIKSLVTGLAATQAEVDAIQANPAAFPALIDTWLALPQADERWLEFFTSAFQQGQVTFDEYGDQFGYFGGLDAVGGSTTLQPLIHQQFRESFPRTALYFVNHNLPFTKTLTTRAFMLTLPLEVLLAHSDSQQLADTANPELTNGRNKFAQRYPLFRWEAHYQGTFPLAATLDAGSADYMNWNTTINQPNAPAVCQANPLVWAQNSGMYGSPTRNGGWLNNFLFGRIVHPSEACFLATSGAGVWAPEPRRTQFSTAELTQWRMITIRAPGPTEKTSDFFDLAALRDSNELLTDTPRVGFFTTPAFFANWVTNTSNQARVTMNQTLIVALGKSFDGTKSLAPISEEAVNGAHASSPACYGCHRTLDPMRQFFRQAYSLHYHEQDAPAQKALKGVFAFDGVTAQGDDIYALGDLLAAHPRFAIAWAQKLCIHANSALCDETDPAFQAVVKAFRDDDYNFKTLARALFSSSLVTLASATQTFLNDPPVVAIVRREEMCALLSNRLGLADVCGVSSAAPTAVQAATGRLAASLPAVAYSRGAEVPSLPREPTLFYRLGVEQLCNAAATQVIDAPGKPFLSTQPQAAIDALMTTFLQVHSNDARYAALRAVLSEHFAAAKTASNDAKKAMTSTFVLACLSPSNTGSGL